MRLRLRVRVCVAFSAVSGVVGLVFSERRGGAVPCVLVVSGLLVPEVAVLLSVLGVWVISKGAR